MHLSLRLIPVLPPFHSEEKFVLYLMNLNILLLFPVNKKCLFFIKLYTFLSCFSHFYSHRPFVLSEHFSGAFILFRKEQKTMPQRLLKTQFSETMLALFLLELLSCYYFLLAFSAIVLFFDKIDNSWDFIQPRTPRKSIKFYLFRSKSSRKNTLKTV